MPLVNRTISNLFGGVSQQAAGVRLDNQCEELVNAYPSIADGLVKRPPSEFIAPLTASEGNSDSMFHTINRDGAEKYIVVFTGDVTDPIEVFSAFDGTPRTVSYGALDEGLALTPDAAVKGYVSGGTPSDDIAATTAADYTIVVNKTKVPAMLASSSPTQLPLALVTVPHGVASQTYKVFINGVEKASYTSGDSNSPETWRTTEIAAALYADLVMSLTTGWHIATGGSTIAIVNTAGEDFILKVEDSWGDQALVGIKESVRRFEDLPETLPTSGSLENDFDVVTVQAVHDSAHYMILVNSVIKADWQAGYSATTESIALALYNQLSGSLLSNPLFRISRNGPAITIWKTDGTHDSVTIMMMGTQGGVFDADGVLVPQDIMTVTSGTMAEVIGMDYTSTVFAVKPDPTTQNGTYYVRWNTLTKDGKTTSGNWEECTKKGMAVAFNDTTMPHRLVRIPDGNFAFAPIVWADREVGDEITAPDPTFVGAPIQDVFFFKNRLGFLAKSSAILSRGGGEFFDFFPSTATDVLDDDPIDAECSSKQVAILRYGLPFQAQLSLFSDQQQFTFGSGDALLTPKSATGDPTATVAVDRCEPVPSGSNIYFASPVGEYTAIREMFISADTLMPDSADVTAHCPTYVPGNIKKMAACEGKKTIFVLSYDEPTKLYVYTYYWNGNEKIQSAWGTWTFDSEILYMDVIGNMLYLMIDGTTVTLEKINLETKSVTTGLTFKVLLDRQAVLSGSYGAGVTAFTAPYPVLSTDRAFNSSTGECVDVTVTGAATFSVPGNWSGAAVIFGRPYELEHRFSEFGMKSSNPKVYNRVGRCQMRTTTLSFEDTMSFDVVVRTVGRAPTTQRWRATSLVTGVKRFTTLGDSSTTRISIKSDSHLPCKFGGCSYEVMYAQRSK